MWSCNQWWIMLVTACLAAACLGCQDGEATDGPDQPNGRTDANAADRGRPDRTASTSADQTPEPPKTPAIPRVNMTEELAATCKVAVDDLMPDGKLQDLDDNEQSLSELYGEKLTIVFFWTSHNAYAMAELGDLTADVAEPYFEKGLRVIGINQGDTAEVVAQEVQDAGVKFPALMDPGGVYFAKVATEKLPRTYVLDAEGKILWFDTEYSEITRSQLLKTIRAALGER